MNKTIAMLPALIMLVGIAAATGITWTKTATVTGDWKWDGGWQHGEYPTAQYNFGAASPTATAMYYTDFEQYLGTPWKYQLNMDTGANAPAWTRNQLEIVTVNNPETTPATGGYTQYAYTTTSNGDYTHTTMSITGEGWANINTATNFDTQFTQTNLVKINPQL